MLVSKGNVLLGHSVTDTKFQGVTTINQLAAFGLRRPSLLETATGRKEEGAAADLHAATNRSFTAQRKARAENYAGYILAVESGSRFGGVPAVTLYHGDHLKEVDGGIEIPYDAILAAIDGETQTEARYILKESNKNTADFPIAVTIYHGIPAEHAKQILHDYNHYAHPVSEKEAASFNTSGPISKAVVAAIKMSGIPKEKLNTKGLLSTKKTVVSYKQLMIGFAGHQFNGIGSTRSVSANNLSEMNNPTSPVVPDEVISAFGHIIERAFHDEDIGKSPLAIWQIAGVKLSKGTVYTELDWGAALSAYERTKSAGRGGKRMPMKERLAEIEAAM